MLDIIAQHQLASHQWAIAFLAAFLLGISKAGLKGISILFVTLLAIVFGSKASTGILLPMLCMGDIMAVIYYRRHAEWPLLRKLLPWMLLGVLFATWFGKSLPESLFKNSMAGIILLTVGIMAWWEKQKNPKIPTGLWFSGSMGLAAGIATMLGNLAGAFSNLFFLAMRVDKNTFLGTAAWLFLIVNLFKVPFHIFSWHTITWQTAMLNLMLLPAIGLGFFVGIKIVAGFEDSSYRKFILVVTLFGALVILFR